jgi:hypothetical protein
MSNTDHITPTGQDYLALSLLELAHTDSLERQIMLGELYDTGDFPYSYETEDQPEPSEKQIEKFERDIQKESPVQPEKIPSIIETALVGDLEFVRVSDFISHKWCVWEVRFTYDGKPCCGDLGGCPRHPTLQHDDLIENCETDF